MRQQSVRSNEANRTTVTDVGGGMYGVSLQSTFGSTLTTKFSFNYNNKQGNDQSSYDQEPDRSRRACQHLPEHHGEPGNPDRRG